MWRIILLCLVVFFVSCPAKQQFYSSYWVIIGDSQAEGHPATHSALHNGGENVYGQISFHLEEMFSEKFYNHGIGGQTTKQVLQRWKRDADKNAKGVIVVAGVNDIAQRIPVKEIAANLRKMDSVCTNCYFLNIPPDRSFDSVQIAATISLNKWMNENLHSTVIDYNKWFKENNSLIIDEVHPCKEGYRMLSGFIAQFLRGTTPKAGSNNNMTNRINNN